MEEDQQVQVAQVLEAEQVLGGLYKEPRGAKESPWRQDGELSKADR